jgi:hypothetical protein
MASAFAQEGALAANEDAAYRSTINDALAEYDAGHFEEARILFRRAHAIAPNARTWRSIGMASFELRDYVAAVHALSASLVDTRKPLSPEQRTHVQGLLERSRLFVDLYTLKVTPPDARVLIDGGPPELESDGKVLLGAGTHDIEVSKPGYLLRTFSVSVQGGERKQLVVTLEAKTQAAARPSAAQVAGGTARKSAPPDTTRSSGSGGGWLLAAGAAGLAGVGAGAYWFFEYDQLQACRTPTQGLRCTNRSDVETKRNLAAGATLVAGVAAITLAVIGVLSGSAPQPASAHSSLSCAVLPSGVVCSTSF